MGDLVYLALTIGAFALLIGYIAGCERLTGEGAMNLEYWLGGAIVAFLLGYLLFSLLYPERF